MLKLHTRLLASSLAAGALVAGLLVSPASAAPTDVTFEEGAYGAPAHSAKGTGGIGGAYAYCGDDEDEPETYAVVVRQGTRTVASRSGEAAYDWVRVVPGTYQVVTTAGCGGPTASKTDSVTVGRLTNAQTVSPAEFKKIKKGQKLSKVTKVVGGKLDKLGKHKGRTYYAIANTNFGEVAVFEFKGKKLKKKTFSVSLED